MNPHPRFIARRLAAVFSIVVTLLSFASHARAATPAEEKLHNELRELKTVYENAINSGNLAPLEPLFAPDSTGVVVDNQEFKTFAELKGIYDRFRASFPNLVYKITVKPELSQLYGDIAVARGACDEYVKTDNGEFTYTSTFTAVLRRTDAGWKLIRSQVTMDPFGNSVVRHFLSRTKFYFGVGALAVGLIVGLILGRLTGRKAAGA